MRATFAIMIVTIAQRYTNAIAIDLTCAMQQAPFVSKYLASNLLYFSYPLYVE